MTHRSIFYGVAMTACVLSFSAFAAPYQSDIVDGGPARAAPAEVAVLDILLGTSDEANGIKTVAAVPQSNWVKEPNLCPMPASEELFAELDYGGRPYSDNPETPTISDHIKRLLPWKRIKSSVVNTKIADVTCDALCGDIPRKPIPPSVAT